MAMSDEPETLTWSGDDEWGWLGEAGDQLYSVTKYMTPESGRGKNKKPGHFIYNAYCIDMRRIRENPRLFPRAAEYLRAPSPPGAMLAADEAKAACEADYAKRRRQQRSLT
jgi:hypothetical protein